MRLLPVNNVNNAQVQTDGRVTPIAVTQNTVNKAADTVRQIREQFVVRLRGGLQILCVY